MTQIQVIEIASAGETRGNGRDGYAEKVQDLRDSVSASARAEGRSNDAPIAQLQAEANAQFEQVKAQLSNLSVEELKASAQTELASSDITRMSELLIGQEERELAEHEGAELNTLHEKMLTMAATRTAALWLLKNRMEQGRSVE